MHICLYVYLFKHIRDFFRLLSLFTMWDMHIVTFPIFLKRLSTFNVFFISKALEHTPGITFVLSCFICAWLSVSLSYIIVYAGLQVLICQPDILESCVYRHVDTMAGSSLISYCCSLLAKCKLNTVL